MTVPTSSDAANQSRPRLSYAGEGGLLLDVGGTTFDAEAQRRLWAIWQGPELRRTAGLHDVVLGVNSLLIVFDPLTLHPADATDKLRRLWEELPPVDRAARDFEVGVDYGGPAGLDLDDVALATGLSAAEVVAMHGSATYTVACLGSMPGFAYMVGLPPALTLPRRKVPRTRLDEGAVIIAGVQASILPITAPCGWHVLGRTELRLFDAGATEPCLLAPGDRVHFRPKALAA